MTSTSSVRLAGGMDPRDGWTAERCPMAAAFDQVRTRSAFLILREALYGTTRFGDFATRVGISEPVAAERLKELVADGLLVQEDYREPGQRARKSYVLTEKGAELAPVLVALKDWGDRWVYGGEGPVELRHAGCGAKVHVEVRCEDGHEIPDAGALELHPGPGARRSVRRSA
ncbi:MAG: helix-turn-helix transcriptional regulator [Solirubrobacteraceae bacterium]|nr:helix-turn-helix transcriptional regulator [Solirubrobacteraceae bacterium]